MEKITSLLKQVGLKATKTRLEVLALLIESHEPLSIEDMQKKLGSKSPDRVTLYRMMQQFYDVELVRRVDFREGFERFEFQDHHHHHVVCTDCGLIEGFESCDAESISKRILSSSKHFKIIQDHTLELFGICKKCAH